MLKVLSRSAWLVLALMIFVATTFFSMLTAYASDSNYDVNLGSFWNNECYWVQDNVNTRIGYNFSMHFTDFLNTKIGDQYYVYYISNAAGDFGTGLATTTDGVNFTNRGKVLGTTAGSYDSTYAAFSGTWYDGTTYYLTYEAAPGADGSADIALATSTDGVNFTKNGVILRNATSGWEAYNIGTPDLYKSGSTWYLTYHGYDGTDCKVGFASGSNINSLSKHSGNPVISTGASGLDSGTIGKRGIYIYNNYYYMVYEISTDQPYDQATWSTSVARSPISGNFAGPWEKFPQMNIIPAKPNGYGNDGPDIINMDGTMWMYYRGAGGGNYTKRARLANETTDGWGYDRLWEAESMSHQIGRADGDGWSANTAADSPAYLTYGPYVKDVPTGENLAVFKMSIDNNTANNDGVVRIEVNNASKSTVIASKDITRKMFKQTNHYEFFTLPYLIPASMSGDMIEYRIYWYDTAYIKADRVLVKYGDSNPHARPVQFSDNFDDGNDKGWTKYNGTWAVESGEYSGTSTAGQQCFALYSNGSLNGTNYTLQADVKIMTDGPGDGGLVVRATDNNNNYTVAIRPGNIQLYKVSGGTWTSLGSASATTTRGNWYTFKVVINGTNIKVYQGDTLLLDKTDSTFRNGLAGLRTCAGTTNSHIHFDNVSVN